MSQAPLYKRWYDRQPRLAQAVRLMALLPNEIKSIIGDGVMLLANREFQLDEEQVNVVRTLGAERVLGLHKSKNKRREYDQNQVLHKAMNYLYILSLEHQDLMADHILCLVRYIQEYLSTCQAFRAAPSLEDVATITQTYINESPADVEKFLVQLRDEFYQHMLAGDDPGMVVDFLETLGQDEVMELKLVTKSAAARLFD